MPADKHGPGIKNPDVYEELRSDGASKEKAARISNAMASEGASKVGRRGGKSPAYEEWTVAELRQRAAELDVEGRSYMRKDRLIDALRNH
ncbi:Rho termination factor N-terminal domain-containing protein [Nocardioides sp. zg-536]|uniref:Rho termination factor N-terminal domain-containing protein n=1 Tax=Nocardioides faecalis TaxID=2803858 RepID=A0A938YCG1_9ACTN|nr:Rho termination factor N-terminal domain-containing protein [Nocardioides faecalis]MBM9461466.1 Rho termination factor N-terminal domain-containing protein [Nocardioides faecalis]MBS4751794.1 Rho termination factor N-terminal domain-containing protein [Nocardioides faecalis]QVI59347.1 Rho termination factor N-terminal domain-containing protein [Nocardioides faecalis]